MADTNRCAVAAAIVAINVTLIGVLLETTWERRYATMTTTK